MPQGPTDLLRVTAMRQLMTLGQQHRAAARELPVEAVRDDYNQFSKEGIGAEILEGLFDRDFNDRDLSAVRAFTMGMELGHVTLMELIQAFYTLLMGGDITSDQFVEALDQYQAFCHLSGLFTNDHMLNA